MFQDLIPALQSLYEMDINYSILFLDASDAALIKRFKESRRMHPLAPDGRLSEGISKERLILQPIREKADVIIDTTSLTPRQLKEAINDHFVEGKTFSGLITNIVSFGFKYGMPIDCDLVFDVRYIPNPFYIPELKEKTGLDTEVEDYVMNHNESRLFLNKLVDMVSFLIPLYVKEGKTQLIVGIGCTGGKHRSVTIARKLYDKLKLKGFSTVIEHRDIDKDNKGGI